MVLRLTALLSRHWMGVVEPDQALAIRPVQRQRVIQAMRLCRRYCDPRHHEPNPMAARRIDDQHLPVEVEKRIESRVTGLRHGI